MKNRLYKLLTTASFAAVLVISGTGCKKTFLDINTNPNSAIDANITPNLLLPAALTTTSTDVTRGYDYLGRWMGFFVTSSGVAPSVEEESYGITTGFGNGAFSGIMDNNYDYKVMGDKAAASGMTFYSGIAKIMMSLNYARMVDCYGSVPYTEALKGVTFLTPKYDDGKAIYEDLIKQIDAGMAEIKGADVGVNIRITTADIMFKGDKAKWARFGNTLKLRLLMHQANRSDRQSYITTEMAKIVAEGSGFLGAGESGFVNPGYNQAQPNPFFTTFAFTLAGAAAASQTRANAIVLNYFKSNQDLRLPYLYRSRLTTTAVVSEPEPTLTNSPTGFIYVPTTGTVPVATATTVATDYNLYRGGTYGLAIVNALYPSQTNGFLSGLAGATSASTASGAPGFVKGYAMDLWILTSVESKFLQVEAMQRGYLAPPAGTTIEQAYKDAVKESFNFLAVPNVNYVNPAGGANLTATAFDYFYAQQSTAGNTNVSWVSASDKLKLIAFQKYLGLSALDFMEMWTEYRRNGYPNIPLSQNTSRSGGIPNRLLFTQAEINYNTANVPLKGRSSGDQFTDKIWWMP
ncbi:SusD/RagB family nutrient-binding outer membrane lipoprotein [Hufsiella ginkgonis]|uniref:SusD/RagB family nutrient-binding outer membrane lipoprotein n=1 Tax=Hufsiella ginkgonis TaxID=2695274 RepID=A0A7K1Y4W4_9SPHI|nr:SusD/RagB family nutrient-binding outer membrane lipoprotein [Hufsiella ginkgonis]MXV17756.1 SusD/RagB family nutrient-binding outer membrane lipoprotein [Hufsiella ginkgonis]